MASILLTATKDTMVDEGNPTDINGTDNLILVGYWDDAQHFIAGGFPFTNIPSKAIITKATLRVYRSNFFPADDYNGNPVTEMDFYVKAVTGAWGEATTNWNNKPAVTASNQVTWNITPAIVGTVKIEKDITTLFAYMFANSYDSVQMQIKVEAHTETFLYAFCREAGESGGLSRVTEILVEYELPSKVNVGDVWKPASNIKVNVGDAWKPASGMKVNIGDVWKEVF